MPKGTQGQKRKSCGDDKARFEAKLGKLAKAKASRAK